MDADAARSASASSPPAHVELVRRAPWPYRDALAWQHDRAEAVRAGRAPEALALLEHPPVYTMGARGGRRHVRRDLPAELVDVDRGGDITFHGPGQLVAYPILDVRSRGLHAADYVRALEDVLIATLARFEIEASRLPGLPGVWLASPAREGAKIAAIGVRIQRGVSRHGVALNVSTDLSWFDAIVPCGIAGAGVTTMQRALGEAPPMAEVERAFVDAFAERFGVRVLEGAAA